MRRMRSRIAAVGAAVTIMAVPFAGTANAGVVNCTNHLLNKDVPTWLNCTMDTVSYCLFYFDPLEPNPVGDAVTFADCTL